MGLDAATHARLMKEAAQMDSGSHVGFIADMINVLTSHKPREEAPRHALRVLAKMWGTAYANRDDPKAALNDVGCWLESRLNQQPAPTAPRIAEEAVWLKRLARYHESLGRVRRGGQRGKGRVEEQRFGRTLR